MSEYKTCTRCKLVLHRSKFYRQSTSKDGLTCYCSCCKKKAVRNNYTSNGKVESDTVKDLRQAMNWLGDEVIFY